MAFANNAAMEEQLTLVPPELLNPAARVTVAASATPKLAQRVDHKAIAVLRIWERLA